MNYQLIKPILLTAFNRPYKTRQLVDQLLNYNELKIYAVVDGPRDERDIDNCKNVVAELKKLKKNHYLRLCVRDLNYGCGKSISAALNWFLSNEECGIILEDDIRIKPNFLAYLSTALEYYKNNTKIWCISSAPYVYPGIDQSCFLSRYPNIWGWGIWRRSLDGYQLFYSNKEIIRIVSTLIKRRFSLLEVAYWGIVVKLCSSRRIDTWDIQFFVNLLINKKMCLVPPISMASNIGFDQEASHVKKTPDFYNSSLQMTGQPNSLSQMPSFTELPQYNLHYDNLIRVRVFKISLLTLLKLIIKYLTTMPSSYNQ